MTANKNNIIAAIAAGGGAGSFAYFAPQGTAAPAATPGTAGVQTVSITGTPASGTFTLIWNGLTTAPIVYNAAATVVATALNAVAGFTGGSQITATGGPLPTAVLLTFPARLKQAPIVGSAAGLTGGTTPTVTVTQTTPGIQSAPAAFAVPGAGWLDAGWCDPKGFDLKSAVSSTDIKGFGTFAVLDTIVTEMKKTGDIVFLETNPTVLAIYNSLPIGSVTVGTDGSMAVATGNPAATKYAAYFLTNNANGSGSSYYLPSVLVSAQVNLNTGMGTVMDRGVTLSSFPDAVGNTLYENHVVANLAS